MNLAEKNLSSKVRFILLAYKPYSEYWDGCNNDRYDSGFEINSTDSEDTLIEAIAVFLVRNTQLGYEEDGWNLTIIDNGEILENIQPYLDLAQPKADETCRKLTEQRKQDDAKKQKKKLELELANKRREIERTLESIQVLQRSLAAQEAEIAKLA